MKKKTKIEYYRLSVDVGEIKDVMGRSTAGACEIYLKINGEVKEGNYFAYSGGCFPKDRGIGALALNRNGRVSLTKLTKEEYERLAKRVKLRSKLL